MTRRTLLLLSVGIVLVLALFFIVRGRSTSSSAAVATATPARPTLPPAQVERALHRAQLVSFARAILPELSRAAQLMDHTAATAATAKSVTGQFNVCNFDSGRVTTVQTNAESVQWPPGGTPARRWRHRIMGVFHTYLGAIVECRNAYDTQDAGQAAAAVSDLADTAKKMHREANRARVILSKRG